MSQIMPAPYESAPDDDLAAASMATLAVALGALVGYSLGRQAWTQWPTARDLIDAKRTTGVDLEVLVTTAGWAAAAVLMVLGAVLLAFRRGRGLLVFGSLVGVVVTVIARYSFDWFTPGHFALPNLPVYFGGAVVLVLALLPATRRWVNGRRPRSRCLPPVSSATALTPTRVQIGQAR